MTHPIDDIIIDLAKAAPGLVALIIVTYFFLVDRRARDASRDETLKEISGNCHDSQDRATLAIDKVTLALLKVIETVNENSQLAQHALKLLDSMERRLNGKR